MTIKQFAVVGNARLTDERVINLSQDVGRIIAEMAGNLICGGLGGVMLESCRGFKSIQSTGSTVGILPSHDARSANEFIDIVEYLDNSNDTIAFRFERYQNEIKNGAQLIVREGQTAVFVSEGQLADVFTPGTYTLNTQNLPILSTLKGCKIS